MNQKRMIRLSAAEDVKTFVGAAGKCEFDIDIGYAGFRQIFVDAKSLLGILSLDLSQPLAVCYEGYDGRWEQVLDQFSVA